VTEDYLSEIPIALPKTADDGIAIINAVRKLVDGVREPELETEVFQQVLALLGISRRHQIVLMKGNDPTINPEDEQGDEL